MRRTGIVFNRESNCQTLESKNFCIREYVSAIRERDPEKCWPFEPICGFKNLKVAENTIDPECKGKKVESEAPTAFKFDLNKGNDTGSETDTDTEIITSKEVNGEIISGGGPELVNLSESENEESVNGGTKTETIVITDDANSGNTSSKQPEKRKCRVLSELLRDIAGPDIESTLHFDDKVDENTDESDEDFTIDDEDDSDSDDDTLGMFLRKRKAVKITSRRNGSRNYNNKKKKTRAPKPSNRVAPKCTKARTKRAKPHPHHNFATRKLPIAIHAEVAPRQSVVGQPVSGSKDPGPGSVVDTPRVCKINRNPADYTSPGPVKKYMRRF